MAHSPMFPSTRVNHHQRHGVVNAVILLMVMIASAGSQPQFEYLAEAEKLFEDGLALYKKGEFADAARVFDEVVVMFPRSHRETAAWVMKGKALLYAGKTGPAHESLIHFLRRFSFSTYVPDVHYTLGVLYVRQHKAEEAVESFLTCLRSTGLPSALRQRVLAALDSTIDMLVTVPPLRRLIAESPPDLTREFLLLKLGQKHVEAGDVTAAAATLDSLQRQFLRPSFPERHAALRKSLLEPRALKVGVLLPLFQHAEQGAAREREVGLSLYEGIQLAFEEFLQRGGAPRTVELEVKDSERDASVAVARVKELCADPGVIGIIGPPFSNTAYAVAYHVNTAGVPLVTPTANANGIAATGPYVFQANPDFTARAKAMARYAVLSLGLLRLGVLAPNEPNSRLMAETFTAEAKRLGATVLSPEFYEPGSTSLVNQLMSMRRKANEAGAEPYLAFGTGVGNREAARLARLGVSQQLLDSLLSTKAVVNAIGLLGNQARMLLDAESIPYRAGDPRVDSIARPVTALQGLYCPISSPEEIGIVSSQVAYFNIQTRILGSGEWNNERELNAHRRYCTGVTFEADSYTSPSSTAYGSFASKFIQRFGKRPNRHSVYGYDVGTIVFSIVQQGALSREKLRDSLAALPTTHTLHARVSFGARRVNPWLHILEYTGSGVQHVTEIMTE